MANKLLSLEYGKTSFSYLNNLLSLPCYLEPFIGIGITKDEYNDNNEREM